MTNKHTYFERLYDLDMPKLQLGAPITPSTIAAGPFAVVHNGIRGLGAHLHEYLDIVAFLDSSVYRTLTQEYEYEVDKNNQKIKFYFKDVNSEFVIEPIVESDMEKFYPEKKFRDFEEFISYLERLAQTITFGPQVEETDFAITVDETSTPPRISGLFFRQDPKIFRRESDGWVELTPADEDWVDIEEYSWVNVLSGAVDLYDSVVYSDSIDATAFNKYIVGGRTL